MDQPREDNPFLGPRSAEGSLPSRSTDVDKTTRGQRASELGAAYAAAWAEWSSDDADLWDHAVADGLG
ncbi:MAG: antitoxin [Acidimicrobiales bacterium]